MKQEEVFRRGEGNAWHKRNLAKINHDHVIDIIDELQIKPDSIVEVGCGVGRRLARLKGQHKCLCMGIDPSLDAVEFGLALYPDVELFVGTASELSSIAWDKNDLIIFGFCLYLCDREDLHLIAHQADEILKEGGHLVIHDFDTEIPTIRPYHHKEGVYSYKMDHSKLWLCNPAYELVVKKFINEEESVTVLRKVGWSRFEENSEPK